MFPNLQEDLTHFFEVHYDATQEFTSSVYLQKKCFQDGKIKMGTIASVDTQSLTAVRDGKKPAKHVLGPVFSLVRRQVNLPEKYRSNIYITANGLKKNANRESNNVFSFFNIVIDVDCHDARTDSQTIDHAINSLLFHLCEDLDMLTPNTAVKTGRGVQLWYAFEGCSYKLDKVRLAVFRHLVNGIKRIMSDIGGPVNCLAIDEPASKKKAGLFRMPFTWNRNSGSYAVPHFYRDDALDLVEYYNSICYAWETKTGLKIRKKTRGKKKPHRFNPRQRADSIIRLIEDRLAHGDDCMGYRDYCCLIVYNAFASFGVPHDEALNEAMKVNRMFPEPRPERELRSSLSTSMRKKYRFTTNRITEYLDITPKEAERISLCQNKTKRQREHEKLVHKKRNRKKRIVNLFLKGFTQMEIARKVNCSQPTVCRILSNLRKQLQHATDLLRRKREKRTDTVSGYEKVFDENDAKYAEPCSLYRLLILRQRPRRLHQANAVRKLKPVSLN